MFNTLMSLQQPNQQHFQNQSPNFGAYSNQYFNPQSFNEQQPMQQQQQNPNVNLNQNEQGFMDWIYSMMPNQTQFNDFMAKPRLNLGQMMGGIGAMGIMANLPNLMNQFKAPLPHLPQDLQMQIQQHQFPAQAIGGAALDFPGIFNNLDWMWQPQQGMPMQNMGQQIMQNLMPQQRRFTNPHAGLGAAV